MNKALLTSTLVFSFLAFVTPAIAQSQAPAENEVAYSTLVEVLFGQETDSVIERSGTSRDRHGNPFSPCKLKVYRSTKNKSIVIESTIPSYDRVSFYADLTYGGIGKSLRIADDFRIGDERIIKAKQLFIDSQKNTWVSEGIVTITLGKFDVYGLSNLSSISVDKRYRTQGDSSITCDF